MRKRRARPFISTPWGLVAIAAASLLLASTFHGDLPGSGLRLLTGALARRAQEEATVGTQPAYSDFCAAPATPPPDARYRGDGYDPMNNWDAAALETLPSKVPCSWAAYHESRIHIPPVWLCLPDPSVDTMISSAIHQWGWWGGVDEHQFGLAGGYAAGTPLTAAHAAALRAAADARAARGQAPFANTAAAVTAAALPPVPPSDRVLSWCSRERPVVLDVGANVGMFAAHMAASGCTVVAFEPLLENGGRLWQTFRRGGWGRHTFIYKNAVGKAGPAAVSVRYAPRNPGTSRIAETYGAEFDGGGAETVPMVSLEGLFDGSPGRPPHPFLGRPIAPSDIAAVKIDVEGYDGAAIWGLRRAIESGLPPLVKIEFSYGDVNKTSGCNVTSLLRWAYGLRYSAYSLGWPAGQERAYSLADFEGLIFPMVLSYGDASDRLLRAGIPWYMGELMLVHDSAPVPAVFQVSGPGGQAPV